MPIFPGDVYVTGLESSSKIYKTSSSGLEASVSWAVISLCFGNGMFPKRHHSVTGIYSIINCKILLDYSPLSVRWLIFL